MVIRDMKIEQPTDNSLYVTIGNYVYYFDDSIDGENIVSRWHLDDDESDIREDIQIDGELTKSIIS
jgi:hypothetical protein